MDTEFLRYRFCDGAPAAAPPPAAKYRIGVRHVQLLYMFACTGVLGLARGGVGVGVLAMADTDRLNDTYIEVFNWSPSLQGTLLTSFLLGYALMLAPAELYLRRVSGKLLVTAVLVTNGALCVAMPTIAKKGGVVSVCNAHFLLGMAQAALAPADRALLARWLPPRERKAFSGIIFAGLQIGLIFSFPLFATLAAAPLGWELVYYSSAMLTLSSSAAWVMLTADEPKEHPAIGEEECEYIEEGMKAGKVKRLTPPWRSLLRCRPLWAATLAHISTNAVFVFLLVDAPLYVKYALRMPLQEAGWYLMLPFSLLFLTLQGVSPAASWLLRSGFISYVCSVTTFRKTLNAIGAIGTIIGLITLSYLGPDSSKLALVAMTGTMSMSAFQYTGFLENHRDLSEHFSGSLLLVSSTISSGVGALVPIAAGAVLNTDVSDPGRWRVVYLSLAALSVACNLLYTVLGSAERQYWDHPVHKVKFGYHNVVNQLELEELHVKKAIPEEDEDLF